MSIRLLCLGDVMAGENYHHYNRSIRTKFNNHYEALIFEKIKETLFSDVDYLFYNFEYSLVAEDFKFEHLTKSAFAAKTDSLDIFPNSIKKIVNIANNHFSQHGKERAEFTKKVLREKGFLVIGNCNKPTEIKTESETIIIWGVSLIPDKRFNGSYFYSKYESLLSDLSLHEKKINELWVLSIHWGVEYVNVSEQKQINLARKLSERGFDLIIGHHPHVIQPYNQINNTHVFYSLGNFIFDQNFSKKTQQGLAAIIQIKRNKIACEVLYLTKMKKYQVYELTKISHDTLNKFTNPAKRSTLPKSMINILMKILMKLELFINFREVDPQVYRRIKTKFFKKIDF